MLAGVFLLLVSTPLAAAQCQRASLTAIDGVAGDHFGEAVAISGNGVMIGAHRHDLDYDRSGATYVYERSGPDWLQVAEFCLPQGQGIGFGRPVALVGDTAIIGSTGWPRVYQREGDDWVQLDKLLQQDHEMFDGFGDSLAFDGQRAIVGAPYHSGNGSGSGSAYVFERDPNGIWSQAAKLVPDDGAGGDEFGYSVAIDGDVVVIGAPSDEDLGNWSGSAYVFERDPNGSWWQAAKLLASDGQPFTGYGYHIAVSADAVMVGANDAEGNEAYTGAVYVYERDPNGAWPEVAKLVASDGVLGDAFGSAVAISADLAVIGADGDDDHGQATGAAYVVQRTPSGNWEEVAKVTAGDGAAYDYFGDAVALDGNTAVIGAYQDDDHGTDSGSAYVFAVGPDADGNGVMDVCECIGDLDGDYEIGLSDLAQLLANYGTASGATYEDGDIEPPGGDGDVDLADLSALLAVYRTTCW